MPDTITASPGPTPPAEAALVILSHGSPRPASNRPVQDMAEQFRLSGEWKRVEIGYLECNAPSIPEALDACAEDSPAAVVIVPFFLHTGKHVVLDIPTLVREAELRHPGVKFLLAPYLGSSPVLTSLLAKNAESVLEGM